MKILVKDYCRNEDILKQLGFESWAESADEYEKTKIVYKKEIRLTLHTKIVIGIDIKRFEVCEFDISFNAPKTKLGKWLIRFELKYFYTREKALRKVLKLGIFEVVPQTISIDNEIKSF